MNIDDIRARAGGVGWHSTISHRTGPNTPRIGLYEWLDKSEEPKLGNVRLIADSCTLQAALDIIEAEERRQVCPRCNASIIRDGISLHNIYSYEKSYTGAKYGPCPVCKGTGKKVP